MLLSLKSWADFSGAVTTSTAGTGRGSAEGTGSFFLNPATLNYLKGYQLNTTYNTAIGKTNNTFRDFQVYAFDNTKDTVFPAALSFREQQIFFDEKPKVTKVKWNEMNIVVSHTVLPRVSLGGSLNYRNFFPPPGAIDRDQTPTLTQWNGTIGVLLAPAENIGLGLVLENPFGEKTAVPEAYRYLTKTSLGASYILSRTVKLKSDFSTARNNSWTKPTASIGLETFLNSWIVWRLGAGKDFDQQVQTYAAGIGFQGPKFGLHYGFEKSDVIFERHAIDLSMPLW